MNYSNRPISNQNSAALSDDPYRDTAKSSVMIRLIAALGCVTVFYIFMLIEIIKIKIKFDAVYVNYSSSIAFTSLLGDLAAQIDLMLIAIIIILIARLLPIISCIAIYSKSRNYNSPESTIPFLTIIQVFGILEALAWGALAAYDIYMMIKNGFRFPTNAGSMYYMVFTLSVVILICKILQGIFIPSFIGSVKKYIRTGGDSINPATGLKFATVMLGTANSIILIFIIINIIMVYGIDTFFDSFGSLWYWYILFLSYTLSNVFFLSLMNNFYRRLDLSRISSKTPSSNNSYSPFNTYAGGYGGMDQNAQPSQNYFSQGQNNPPYHNNFSQGQNNSPYQNNFSQGQNNPPSQGNNSSVGTGFSESYNDIFKFNDHN